MPDGVGGGRVVCPSVGASDCIEVGICAVEVAEGWAKVVGGPDPVAIVGIYGDAPPGLLA
jgi:hypothetical protein